MVVFYIILFLILSAFFSGSEIGYVSANKLSIELKREKGRRRGKIMASFYDRPESFLSTMLVGNNIALVLFTIYMEIFFTPYLSALSGFWLLIVLTLISTVVVLIFGEFLPKTLFRIYSNDLVFAFTYPLNFFIKLFHPITWIVNKITTRLLNWISDKPIEKNENILTRFDLENFVAGDGDRQSEEIETDMFKNVLHLKSTKVRDIMVPRTEIICIDQNATIKELVTLITESKHSRILVVNEDIDNILGYVHHQQIFNNPESIRKMILQLPIIPETMNIQALMLKLIKEQTNIAWVVDEFGGTAGLITLEDILEEIFGEIEDEHDEEGPTEIMITESEYLFSGRLEIDYLNEKYPAIELPTGDYSTLSGYIVMATASLPEEGDTIDLGNYRFILEVVSEKKIEEIRVQVKDNNE